MNGGDAVVVGAGLIGLGVAYELARRGAHVVVVDRGEPAAGASWAGAGMLAPDGEALALGPLRDLCVASLGLYPEYVARLREESGVDARLRLDGIMRLALTDDDEASQRDQAVRLRAAGVGARRLSRAETIAREPAVTSAARGALLIEREGQVDNRRLGRALRAACERRGIRIVAQAGDVAIEADARRVRGLRAAEGFIAAGSIVNAAGAWAGALSGIPTPAQVPVYPVKGQMLALAAPRGLIHGVVWYRGGYAVPRDDGRLLIGATVEDVGFDVRVTAHGQRRLLDDALDALPALRDIAVSETWAGLRPATPDGLPYIGATVIEGYLCATGHYRNGILLVPATALALADLIEGIDRPDLAAFSPTRVRHDGPETGSAKRSA